MNTQSQNASESEDLGPVDTEANKRSKTSTDGGEISDPIPVDLIIDVFLRLPAKSVARFRCVSKRWDSLLRLPYFTDSFFTRSSARPQLLFACKRDGHVFFFSSPEPRSLDENSSLSTTSYYHMEVPYVLSFDARFSCIRGLVFLRIERGLKGKGHVSVICNPSTGQSMILPQVKTRRKIGVRSYIGYDPIEKQYKVLSMTWTLYGSRWLLTEEHQVLTLGGTGGEPSWRKIECPIPHTLNYKYHHVCIDGVLYYPAERSSGNFIIVCFDLRTETFRSVKDTDTFTQLFRCAPLINYNGKLASLGPEETIHGSCTSIRLRVLEDVEKQEWSEHTYLLPDVWKNIVGDTFVRFVGVTRTNEIVLSSLSPQCLLYFNTESCTVVRVGLKGMEAVEDSEIFAFQDHVEDVRLMEVF